MSRLATSFLPGFCHSNATKRRGFLSCKRLWTFAHEKCHVSGFAFVFRSRWQFKRWSVCTTELRNSIYPLIVRWLKIFTFSKIKFVWKLLKNCV